MANGFSGGEGMTSKLQEMMDKLGVHHTVRVGFLEGSNCGKNNDASAPQIANILEFGAPAAHIPARPFFRNMIDKTSPTWSRLLQAALKAQDNDSASAMEMVGLKLAEYLQQSMEEFDDPGNADSTVKKKGFDKPLEDSKNLKRAADFQVTDNGGAE